MNPDEFLAKIKQIEWEHYWDVETMHSKIDEAMEDLLSTLGYYEAVEYMRKLERWYA